MEDKNHNSLFHEWQLVSKPNICVRSPICEVFFAFFNKILSLITLEQIFRERPCLWPCTPYLRCIRMLVLQLFQVQLIDFPKDQKLPIQEFHLLLNRLAVRKLRKKEREKKKIRAPRNSITINFDLHYPNKLFLQRKNAKPYVQRQ